MPASRINLGPAFGPASVLHSPMVWGLGGVIFVHDIGETRHCFNQAFTGTQFENYNLVAPDLPGFGNTPAVDGATLSTLLDFLETLVAHFFPPEQSTPALVLVGHGLGADLCTYLAKRGKIAGIPVRGIVNIEGTLGPSNFKLVDPVLKAARNPRVTFPRWFKQKFAQEFVLEKLGQTQAAYRRYYEALQLTKPRTFKNIARQWRTQAFLTNAEDYRNIAIAAIAAAADKPEDIVKIFTQFEAEADDMMNARPSAAMETYKELDMAKLYLYGENGFSAPHAKRLEGLQHLKFTQCGHWPMHCRPDALYSELANFLTRYHPQPSSTQRVYHWFLGRWRTWLNSATKVIKKDGRWPWQKKEA